MIKIADLANGGILVEMSEREWEILNPSSLWESHGLRAVEQIGIAPERNWEEEYRELFISLPISMRTKNCLIRSTWHKDRYNQESASWEAIAKHNGAFVDPNRWMQLVKAGDKDYALLRVHGFGKLMLAELKSVE